MRRSLAGLAALLLTLGGTSHAQVPPPVTKFGVLPAAIGVLDSLARTSWSLRLETAGCVERYAVAHDTLLIAEIGPAHYARSDSMSIVTADSTGICPPGVPSVHTHLAGLSNPLPSPIDSMTARRMGVWSLVLAVDSTQWRLVLYGGRPSPTPH